MPSSSPCVVVTLPGPLTPFEFLRRSLNFSLCKHSLISIIAKSLHFPIPGLNSGLLFLLFLLNLHLDDGLAAGFGLLRGRLFIVRGVGVVIFGVEAVFLVVVSSM